MLRSLSILVAGSLAVLASCPTQAAVSGTLHINAGYSFYTNGLVPDKDVNFVAATEPQMLTFQQDFPNEAEPPVVVYSRSANTMMDGDEGVLWGHVDAELNGIPPTNNYLLGIYGEASLRGSDYFTVDSDVLDDGELVEVAFRLDVLGNGPVDSQLSVDRILNNGGHTGVLHLSYASSQVTGSFMATVGDLYEVNYNLKVSGPLTIYGLSEGNPTKFIVSDYIAHVYGGPTQPPAVVSLGTNSGHDYSEPVPEPSAALSGASGVLVLLRLAQRPRGPRV